MNELSIFIDESGDFGEYDFHSPYYIIAMVMHDQSYDITEDLAKFEKELHYLGYSNHCVHVGPIIRQEQDYRFESMEIRQRILKKMMSFFRQIDIKCKTVYIEKKNIADEVEAAGKLAKLLSRFLRDNMSFFSSYDSVKVYYDNGQIELNKILSSKEADRIRVSGHWGIWAFVVIVWHKGSNLKPWLQACLRPNSACSARRSTALGC